MKEITMKLENGMIVTLENGDRVKVSLEKIEDKVTQLEIGKQYELRYSGEFCHAFTSQGKVSFADIGETEFEYVGSCCDGSRNVYFSGTSYVMFANNSLRHIVREIKK